MLAPLDSDSLILRGLLGAAVASLVAARARRGGNLTEGGQWAAFVLGTVTAIAGWGWAALLIAYFVISSALTRLGAATKAARTASVLPDVHARNAVQVAANGGLFAALAFLGTILGSPMLLLAAVAALSAAAADTWATEIGTLWGGTPRRILDLSPAEPGMSGGITLIGTVASVVAALLVGVAGAALLGNASDGLSTSAIARGTTTTLVLAVAGVVGSLADSVLGASLQSKRWCEQCRTWTERRVHTCQYRTQHARGVRWMTNDTVNLLATVVGALTALTLVGRVP